MRYFVSEKENSLQNDVSFICYNGMFNDLDLTKAFDYTYYKYKNGVIIEETQEYKKASLLNVKLQHYEDMFHIKYNCK